MHSSKRRTGEHGNWMRQHRSMFAVNYENISIGFPKRLRVLGFEGRDTLLTFLRQVFGRLAGFLDNLRSGSWLFSAAMVGPGKRPVVAPHFGNFSSRVPCSNRRVLQQSPSSLARCKAILMDPWLSSCTAARIWSSEASS